MTLRSKLLCELYSLLQAVYMQHQKSHLVAKGKSSYSDHLLFERLYSPLLGELDSIAERAIGLDSHDISLDHTLAKMRIFVSMWSSEENDIRASYIAEEKVLWLVGRIRQLLEKEDQLTLGLEDLLGGIANQHEEHCYLLKQRLEEVH